MVVGEFAHLRQRLGPAVETEGLDIGTGRKTSPGTPGGRPAEWECLHGSMALVLRKPFSASAPKTFLDKLNIVEMKAGARP